MFASMPEHHSPNLAQRQWRHIAEGASIASTVFGADHVLGGVVLVSGFKKFLMRGNLVELAVAFVIGAAFAGLVTALVEDFITPTIAMFAGKEKFADLTVTVNKSEFTYGHFVNAALSFLIVAAVVYFLVVVPYGKLRARFSKEPDLEAPSRACPECLSTIPAAATRCAFCTAESAPTLATTAT
jgi:large conductance mechanosensitive channel